MNFTEPEEAGMRETADRTRLRSLEGRLSPNDLQDRVEAIIGRACLTDHDIDMATSGLCGTFALALYRELTRRGLPAQLVFVCLRKRDGSPEFVPGHDGDLRQVRWRHAVVEAGGAYFDAEGRIEIAHAYANYCWGHWVAGGTVVSVDVRMFATILRQHRPSYDGRYYLAWKQALSGGLRHTRGRAHPILLNNPKRGCPCLKPKI